MHISLSSNHQVSPTLSEMEYDRAFDPQYQDKSPYNTQNMRKDHEENEF